MVSNCGSYTITRVEAQICIGSSMIQPHRQERFASVANLPAELRGDYRPTQEFQMQGVLTQFDWGIPFERDEIGLIHNINPYAVVRWADDLGHAVGAQARGGPPCPEDEQWAP